MMKKIYAFVLAGIMVFSMTACGQSEPETKVPTETDIAEVETAVTEAAETEAVETEVVGIVGGWSRADCPVVTDEIRALLEKAQGNLTGAEYEAAAYLGSQLVSGTNHAVLCRITPVVPDAVARYAVVILYEDLEGNVEILDILDSEAEVEAFPDGEVLDGGWAAPDSPEVTDEAKAALGKALEKLVGAEYVPVALLATQIVSGTNYSLLCEVTPVVPDAEAHYTIVHVYEDLEGNAKITDTFDFVSAK